MTNTNSVTQSADQTQKAGPAGSTQLGGSAQTQIVTQSAPTNQTASAEATSIQSGTAGGSSSATADAENTNHVAQTADQVQVGGDGGSQVQVIVQSAPTNQTATATATATARRGTSSATGTQTNTKDVSQAAEQRQSGGGSQVQVVEQSADDRARTHRGGTADGWVLVPSTATPIRPRLLRWSDGRSAGATAASGSAPARRHSTPQTPQLPVPPQAPVSLGAGVGGTGGGSLWVFAAALIPFLLTAPWWARRQRSSAVRRLMGVVSRLERPG